MVGLLQTICVTGLCAAGKLLAAELTRERYVPETKLAPAETKPAQPGTPKIELASTQETIEELRRRLGKELYRMELDLQGGGRINGKPCDCLNSKHHFGVEATAEELLSYEAKPLYGQIISWYKSKVPDFAPESIVSHEPDYFRAMIPTVRAFRKQVMGTENLMSLLNREEKQQVWEKTNGNG